MKLSEWKPTSVRNEFTGRMSSLLNYSCVKVIVFVTQLWRKHHSHSFPLSPITDWNQGLSIDQCYQEHQQQSSLSPAWTAPDHGLAGSIPVSVPAWDPMGYYDGIAHLGNACDLSGSVVRRNGFISLPQTHDVLRKTLLLSYPFLWYKWCIVHSGLFTYSYLYLKGVVATNVWVNKHHLNSQMSPPEGF